MKLILKAPFQVIDATGGRMRPTVIPAGEHNVERVANPYKIPGLPWLVLEGTQTGAYEESFRLWQAGGLKISAKSHDRFGHTADWGDRTISIHE